MTMPKLVSMKAKKVEKESMAKAKGKNEKSFSNELFAAADDLFYEFGFIPKPSPKTKQDKDPENNQ
jgi:hypothetical protein